MPVTVLIVKYVPQCYVFKAVLNYILDGCPCISTSVEIDFSRFFVVR